MGSQRKKNPRLWLDLGFLDENGHEFLDLAVLPGGVSPGKSHRGPELQATTELTRVGFIWATCVAVPGAKPCW